MLYHTFVVEPSSPSGTEEIRGSLGIDRLDRDGFDYISTNSLLVGPYTLLLVTVPKHEIYIQPPKK